MYSAFERLETREHGSRLDQVNMVMEVVRKTIARSADNRIPTFDVLPDVVFLIFFQ